MCWDEKIIKDLFNTLISFLLLPLMWPYIIPYWHHSPEQFSRLKGFGSVMPDYSRQGWKQGQEEAEHHRSQQHLLPAADWPFITDWQNWTPLLGRNTGCSSASCPNHRKAEKLHKWLIKPLSRQLDAIVRYKEEDRGSYEKWPGFYCNLYKIRLSVCFDSKSDCTALWDLCCSCSPL